MLITEKAKGAERVMVMGRSQFPTRKEKECMATEMRLRMAREMEKAKEKEKALIRMDRMDLGRWGKVVDL
jgi:hypothetical protein